MDVRGALPLTIYQLVARGAELAPDAPALLAPGREVCTYRALLSQMEETIRTLNTLGIGRGDRVATVLPNGVDAAALFLSVAAGAVCAPLNPAYREPEYEFYLSDLRPKALIVASDSTLPVLAPAAALGIPLLRLTSLATAGMFTLGGPMDPAEASRPDFPEPDDTALVLHTSGTTARPKIVPLTNANLCHSAANIRRALRLTPADRCLNIMPLFHIHGLAAGLLSSITAAASVVCPPGFLAPQFLGWLEEFAPTWYTAVPTMQQAILERAITNRPAAAGHRLRFIRSCSAPLAPQLMADLERVFAVPVIESYGMTEAAHQMACNPLPPGIRKPGSVGRAAGPDIAIMDPAGNLLPGQSTGEIVIRGSNVTPGYEDNPEANARSFTAGWFRTGDRGHLDSDGYLFISGRIKEMINRGGEKISPREIDEALMNHPAVAQALAFAIPDVKLGEEVGAAAVLRDGCTVTEYELRQFAAERLADFKVPRRIVFLAEIPKGPTGKPQRIGLAAKLGLGQPAAAPAREKHEWVAPRTPSETLVCAIWQQVLGIGQVGVRDSFFDLGGDSVLAAQVVASIAGGTGLQMPLLAFFEAPSAEAIARWLDAASASGSALSQPPPARRDRPQEAPLSFAQERVWFLAQLDQDAAPYIRPAAYTLKGALDPAALRRSLDRIVARHEVLRTTYQLRETGPVQSVSPPFPVPLETVDLTHLEPAARADQARNLAAAQTREPFDLSRDPMIRVRLLRLAPEEHCLLIAMHHIASDGWSGRIFLQELASLYELFTSGGAAESPALPLQYADYALWQRSLHEGERFQQQLAYWRKHLDGCPPFLPLPTDHPRPARQTYHGARATLPLPQPLVAALTTLSRQEEATLFMTLLAAFQVLLSRHSGADDIAVGCPVANRRYPETEPMIGLFVNTLVMRTDLRGSPSFRELLGQVRQTALAAYTHQDLPFEKLVEALNPPRSLSYPPLVQVLFQLRNLPFRKTDPPGLELEPLNFDPGVAQFDLSLDIMSHPDGLECVVDYNTGLFEAETIRRMLGHYRTLLQGIAKDPDCPIDALPLLSAAERRRVLVEWNHTAADITPAACVHQLLEDQAARTPEAVALIADGVRIRFGEANAQANQLARRLQALGVGRESIAGVCLERSPRAVIALLAVLKTGAAFLPLDPDYPRHRLQFMIEDARPRVVITEACARHVLGPEVPSLLCLDADNEEIARQGTANLPPLATEENAAYVIYTSGSTGVPKGVVGLHRGLRNRLEWMWRRYPFENGEVCCQKTALSFVDSIAEIFHPLAKGVPLAVIPDETVRGAPIEMIDALERHQVTRIVLVPSLLLALLETLDGAGERLTQLRYWISSGETLPAALAHRFRQLAPRGRLLNLYGSTEVSADVTAFEVVPDGTGRGVPIGRPIANTQVYILDSRMRPVPAGITGELYVGGAGLARGYLHRAELTAERFVVNPFGPPGTLLFRTGDLGRHLPDGNIELAGRAGRQVKIRGCRVEPGEVEQALAGHPAVKSAAVAADGGPSGNSLTGYVVCRGGHTVSASQLQEYLRHFLPPYMLPGRFVFLSALPMLANGKLDRSALPASGSAGAAPASAAAVGNAGEHRLTAIWQELLSTSPIGLDQDFFEIGGHSLLAARMMTAIEKQFGIRLPVAALFEAPSIRQLTALITGEMPRPYPRRVIPFQPSGRRPPFFCIGADARLRPLARLMAPDQPFFGLNIDEEDARALSPPYSLSTIAARLVESLREFQPEGPYYLGGHSLQGLCAYEAARQLSEQGQQVPLVVLFDTVMPVIAWRRFPPHRRLGIHFSVLRDLLLESVPGDALAHLLALARAAGASLAWTAGAAPSVANIPNAWEVARAAALNYRIESWPGRIVFLQAERRAAAIGMNSRLGWAERVGQFEMRRVPGDHLSMLSPPNLGSLARELLGCLEPDAAARG